MLQQDLGSKAKENDPIKANTQTVANRSLVGKEMTVESLKTGIDLIEYDRFLSRASQEGVADFHKELKINTTESTAQIFIKHQELISKK